MNVLVYQQRNTVKVNWPPQRDLSGDVLSISPGFIRANRFALETMYLKIYTISMHLMQAMYRINCKSSNHLPFYK